MTIYTNWTHPNRNEHLQHSTQTNCSRGRPEISGFHRTLEIGSAPWPLAFPAACLAMNISILTTPFNIGVSEFAPPQYQRVLSYASGWMSTLGWLASVASSCYVCTTQIQSMIQVTRPDYAFTNWQYTLIMFAIIAITIVFNTWWASILPGLEIASLFGHIVGFFVVFIPILVLCPKNSAYEVFVDFQGNGGWSVGTGYLISQVTILYCNFGSDSVVHISEETKDASIVVPRAMWWSYVGNVAVGILMLIAMLFCIGPLDEVVSCNEYRCPRTERYMLILNDIQVQSTVPYLLLFNNTGNSGLSVFLNVILFILIWLGNVTALATCAREMWAFARDKGLPFSGWLDQMDHKRHIPFNTVYATSAACVILALIQIGSTTAFNIVVSLSTLALLSTYMISIGCVFWKRLTSQPLPPTRWSLGRWGVWINGFAFFYSAFVAVFCCFPTFLPVTTSNANWAPVVWAGVIVISVAWYWGFGKSHYTAPVQFVEGRKVAGTGLQST
jgi:choline transport protein